MDFAVRIFCILGLILFYSISSVAEQVQTDNLNLHRVLELQNSIGLQPSGLAVCDNKLLMVSDKHDSQIFLIDSSNANADKVVARYRQIDAIPAMPESPLPIFRKIKNWLVKTLKTDYLDWEGITCDSEQNLYLVSESTLEVLKVSPGGLHWLTGDIYAKGKVKGLFDENYAEGVAWSGVDGGFYIAAEREPRGILFALLVDGKTLSVDRAAVLEQTTLLSPAKHERSLDFTGLVVSGNYLFTLERNHSAVCRRDRVTFATDRCWSYSAVENNVDFKYVNDRYGMAEGLAVDERFLYIVLDNNNDPRASDHSSVFPLLYIFKLPVNWLG